MLLFYVILAISLIGIISGSINTFRVFSYYVPSEENPTGAFEEGLSVIVPIKGVNPGLGVNLQALIDCDVNIPTEYIFAMETEKDPAYSICKRIQQAYLDKFIRIILTGDPGTRMGKQHNLAEAYKHANYATIGSMDADVHPYPTALAHGLSALSQEGAGTAYHLPYYDGIGPIGGALVAVYTNYFFSQNVGSLALMDFYPLTIGSMWFIKRCVLEEIGGFELLTCTVTDDAALGREIKKVGKRNIPINNPVQVVLENKGFLEGVRQIQKWITMLRAEGFWNYFLIALLWHPLFFGALVALLGWALEPKLLKFGQIFLFSVIFVRLISSAILNDRVYRLSSIWRFLPLMVVYEIIISPVLFIIGFFKKTIMWRDQRYRIGKQGQILDIQKN